MLRPFRNGHPPQVRQHARNHRDRHDHHPGEDGDGDHVVHCQHDHHHRRDHHHRHHPGQDFKMSTVQFVVGLQSAVGLSCNGKMKVSLFFFIATITIVIVIVVTVTVVTRRGGLLGVRNL